MKKISIVLLLLTVFSMSSCLNEIIDETTDLIDKHSTDLEAEF
jgi:hypothetical protein